METKKESMIAVYDSEKNLVAIIHRNETLRTNTVLKVMEATDEEIADIIENKSPNQKI